jgi:hypothetical protein
MNTNLTSEEVSYLIDLLEKEISETKTEIHHSDNHEFKDNLKVRIKFIQDLRNKLNIPINVD